MDLSAWAPLFEDAGEPHVALVYRDHAFLAEAVARWTTPALRAGGGAILVGTPSHHLAVREALPRLGGDVEGNERNGRLVFVDADWLMAHFMLDGTPDRTMFRALCDEIVRGVRGKLPRPLAPVRAWGEMVSILRLRGNPQAAARLEELWQEVIAEHDIALLCSYEIGEGRSPPDLLAKVGASHGQLILQPELDVAVSA